MVIPAPRRGYILLALALLGLAALLRPPDLAWAVPQPPHIFWGPVTVGGNPAPDGLQVVARIYVREGANVLVKTFPHAITSGGAYGTVDRLAVSGDDPDTPAKEGATPGEPIFFFLLLPGRELLADQEPPKFQPGEASPLALRFPSPRATPVGSGTTPGNPRLPGGGLPGPTLGAGEIATVSALVTNFTNNPKRPELTLVRGDRVEQQQTVSIPAHGEARVEFEVPAPDTISYVIRSSAEPGSIVALPPGASQLFFDQLKVTPKKVANGEPALVTVNVNNPGRVLVYRRVFLRVGGEVVDFPRDIRVAPGDLQVLSFEYTPLGAKAGPVPARVGDIVGVITVGKPRPWALYIPLLLVGLLLLAAGLVWRRRRASRAAGA